MLRLCCSTLPPKWGRRVLPGNPGLGPLLLFSRCCRPLNRSSTPRVYFNALHCVAGRYFAGTGL
jgi:hypothetical protein